MLNIARGSQAHLVHLMNSAVKLQESTKAEEVKNIGEFQEMNVHIDGIENFNLLPYEGKIFTLLEKIEDSFQGKFHFLQQLCL